MMLHDRVLLMGIASDQALVCYVSAELDIRVRGKRYTRLLIPTLRLELRSLHQNTLSRLDTAW